MKWGEGLKWGTPTAPPTVGLTAPRAATAEQVPDIQHFDLPFQFAPDGHAYTVAQDTIEDVANCVLAAIYTEPGFRVEVPTFGVPDQVFDLQPLPLQTVIESVILWEKRAHLLMDQSYDPTDIVSDRVTAALSLMEIVNSNG